MAIHHGDGRGRIMDKFVNFMRTVFASGPTKNEFKRMYTRNRFSEYLPYRAYDENTKAFFNLDGSMGWIWECNPLVYAGKQTFSDLLGLFTAGLPEDTVLQFMLYADPNIRDTLDHYKSLKVRDNEFVKEATKRTVEFFNQGTMGVDKMAGIPFRNARLFVVLKMNLTKSNTKSELLGYRDNIAETLKGAGLVPRMIEPSTLIRWLWSVFNGEYPRHLDYDKERPINKQILTSETRIKTKWDKVLVGKRVCRCQTVKRMAPEIDELTMNYLTGDIWGPRADGNQITSPYLFTVNVIFKNMNAALHAKTNLVLKQQIAGSVALSLQRKRDEYLWASGELDRGVRFVKIQPIIWHFSRSEEESRETSARIKRIWDAKGFITQEDRGILNILFLAALPFGLHTKENAVEFIDRHFICHPEVATKCLPIQCDFMGGGMPHILLTGRKGQIIPFDIFSSVSNNYNGLICAESGSGKSFVTNKIAYEMWASGCKIRLIDIGGSYKKLCKIVDGKFINFSKNSEISLNPFTCITDFDEDIASVSAVVSQMIYSKSGKVPNETESTTIKAAIQSVYDLYGNQGDIDKIYEVLKSPHKYITVLNEMDEDCGENCMTDIRRNSTEMAYNLRSFTSEGEYGRWFNGPATLDIDSDDFIVLELEELKAQPELFNVVTLQLINMITSGVYLSDRSKKQMIIFDEAWQFFGESSLLAQVIEEGYRKSRKYFGSFFTVVQSLLDTQQFGRVGSVIRANSAYKLMLQSSDIEKASRDKVIDYPPFVVEILKSTKSPKPRYSEIFTDTPVGQGVVRNVADPFSYLLYTSDANDNNRINALVGQGKTYVEAFKELTTLQ